LRGLDPAVRAAAATRHASIPRDHALDLGSPHGAVAPVFVVSSNT
jgi:hypothetical protein